MSNKPGRNNPCYCASGKKYKNCCLLEDEGFVTLEDGTIKYVGKVKTNLERLGI